MSICGADFLKSSALLVAQGRHEADYRSAASRAYYAALHEAMESLPEAFIVSEAARARSQSSH
jgi:hypothetical protein